MTTTIKKQEGRWVAAFQGRLDTAASAQAEQDMRPLFECMEPEIVLDCTHLEYISSSGLRLFLGLLKSTKPKGIQLFITGMNKDLMQVFSMTGFTSLFQFK